jgi:hypothetical protein
MKLSFGSNSWAQVWSLLSIPIGEQSRYTRNVCPTLIVKPVVACLFSTASIDADTWQRVGFISVEAPSGLTVGGSPDSRLGKRQVMYANRLQIFVFDVSAPEMSLVFDASVVGNVSFFAWEYTGVIE